MKGIVSDHPEIKFVSKGWGFEKIICNSQKYCGKLLYIAKGRRTSLHYHKLKDETFYIQSGKVKIFYSDKRQELEKWMLEVKKEFGGDVATPNQLFAAMTAASGDKDILQAKTLTKGDNFYIPTGRVHQIVAIDDTELFEFSTEHVDSDSYRIVKGD